MKPVPIKASFLAVFWTLLLAVPLTALALSGLAYLNTHFLETANAIASFTRSISVGGRGLSVEFLARWPEIVGMVVGQAVILVILLLARRDQKANEEKK